MARLESQQFSIIGRPRGAYLSRSNMPEGTLSMPWRARGAAVRGIGDALSSLGNAYLNMRLNTRRKNGSLMLAEYQARCNDYLNALGANPERYDVDGAEKFAQWRSDLWATLAEKYEKEGGYDHDDVHRRRDILNIGYQGNTDKAVFRQGQKDEMKSTQTEWMESQATYEATGNPDALRLAAAAMDRYNDAKDGFINRARFEAITQEAREKGTVTTGGRTFRIVKDEKEAQEAEKNHVPHVTEESFNQWSGGTAQRLDTRRKMVAAETGSAVARRIDKLIKAGQLDQARQELDEAKNQSGNWAGIEIPDHVLKTAEDTLSRQEMIRDTGLEAHTMVENSIMSLDDKQRQATADGRFMTEDWKQNILDTLDELRSIAARSGSDKDRLLLQRTTEEATALFRRTAQNLEMAKSEALKRIFPCTDGKMAASSSEIESAIADMCGEDKSSELYRFMYGHLQRQRQQEEKKLARAAAANAKVMSAAAKEQAKTDAAAQEIKGYSCALLVAQGKAQLAPRSSREVVDMNNDEDVRRFFAMNGVDEGTAEKYIEMMRSQDFKSDVQIAASAGKEVRSRFGLAEDASHTVDDFLITRCAGLLQQCRNVGYGLDLQMPGSKKGQFGDATKADFQRALYRLFEKLDKDTQGGFSKWVQKEWKEYLKGKDDGRDYSDWFNMLSNGERLAVKDGIYTIVKDNVGQKTGQARGGLDYGTHSEIGQRENGDDRDMKPALRRLNPMFPVD